MLQWRHLAEIFIFIKMIYHVSFIILVHQIVILSLLISIKLTITKIHHLISLRFERSELKKSQCAVNPIQTRGADCVPHTTASPPGFKKLSTRSASTYSKYMSIHMYYNIYLFNLFAPKNNFQYMRGNYGSQIILEFTLDDAGATNCNYSIIGFWNYWLLPLLAAMHTNNTANRARKLCGW